MFWASSFALSLSLSLFFHLLRHCPGMKRPASAMLSSSPGSQTAPNADVPLLCLICEAIAKVTPDPCDPRNGAIQWSSYKIPKKGEIEHSEREPQGDICYYCMRTQMRMTIRKSPQTIVSNKKILTQFLKDRAMYVETIARYNRGNPRPVRTGEKQAAAAAVIVADESFYHLTRHET